MRNCTPRAYPRAEWEFNALHEYDFEKSGKNTNKQRQKVEDAWERAKVWYSHHIGFYKDIAFEDFAFIHAVLYREVVRDKNGKLSSGYKGVYSFADNLVSDLDKYTTIRARKFLEWLESDAGKWFLSQIREKEHVRTRLNLANALASYYIKTYYPNSINGAMQKYLDFEYRYVGKHVYKLWASPLFWASFGIGMAFWEELERTREINSVMKFVVSDPVAAEPFVTEMRAWWERTTNLKDKEYQLARVIRSINEFLTSGGILTTIAGDVGSAVAADLIRRGVVVGLEALGFLLMNFTPSGRLARGALAVAEFVNKSVLSFLGFQMFVEWPLDGIIQVNLGNWINKIFNVNFNPNTFALDPREIEELRKNKDIPEKWGGLTKYEWAELTKLLKALYMGEFYLTNYGRQRLNELLDKADIRYVNALRLRLRRMRVDMLYRKSFMNALRGIIKINIPFSFECGKPLPNEIKGLKKEIKEVVKKLGENSEMPQLPLPSKLDDDNESIDHYHRDADGSFISVYQYAYNNEYNNVNARELYADTTFSKECGYNFNFGLKAYTGSENDTGYGSYVGYSVNLSNYSHAYANLNGSNYYLIDLLVKFKNNNVNNIRNAKVVKRNGMYYVAFNTEAEREYRIVNSKLKSNLTKKTFYIPLSAVIGSASYHESEYISLLRSVSKGLSAGEGPPQYISRFLQANLKMVRSHNDNVSTHLGHHFSRGSGSNAYFSYYKSKSKRYWVSARILREDNKYFIEINFYKSLSHYENVSNVFSASKWQGSGIYFGVNFNNRATFGRYYTVGDWEVVNNSAHNPIKNQSDHFSKTLKLYLGKIEDKDSPAEKLLESLENPYEPIADEIPKPDEAPDFNCFQEV